MKRLLLAIAISCSFNTVAQEGIYVSDAGNFASPPWQILKYDINGDNPQLFTSENLSWPQDILIIESQNLALISNLSSGEINRHNLTTGAFIDHFATDLNGPTRIKTGPDGYLYVLQWSGSQPVIRYDPDGNFIDAFTESGVNNAIGLDWDQSGNLYVSSYGDATIYRFDSNGQNIEVLIEEGIQGPTNIWFAADDPETLYVSDFLGGNILKYNLDGSLQDTYITGLSQPEGYAYTPAGHLLIGNGGQGSVKRYDAEGNFIEDIVGSGLGGLIRPNAVVYHSSDISATDASLTMKHIEVKPTIGSYFQINTRNAQMLRYSLSDSTGKILEQGEIQTDAFTIHAITYPEGMVYLTIYFADGEIQTKKLVISGG